VDTGSEEISSNRQLVDLILAARITCSTSASAAMNFPNRRATPQRRRTDRRAELWLRFGKSNVDLLCSACRRFREVVLAPQPRTNYWPEAR
jgi:hypothetical protein